MKREKIALRTSECLVTQGARPYSRGKSAPSDSMASATTPRAASSLARAMQCMHVGQEEKLRTCTPQTSRPTGTTTSTRGRRRIILSHSRGNGREAAVNRHYQPADPAACSHIIITTTTTTIIVAVICDNTAAITTRGERGRGRQQVSVQNICGQQRRKSSSNRRPMFYHHG